MLKRIMVVLLALSFQTGVGHANPDLTEVKAFRVYHDGMEKGELIFMVIGNKAICSSPFGVNYIAMNQFDKGSIIFGNLLELAWVIHDVWDDDKQGFRCVVKTKNTGDTIVGYAKPLGRYDSRRSRSLATKTSFRFFGLKGNVDVFDMSSGERTDGGTDNEFSRNGEMLFVVKGQNKGRFYGNAGSSEVEVFRDNTSIVFLETTPGGNKQVTIVQKRWNSKHDGFECTHIRNTMLPNFLSGGTELVRSVIPGIAKPQ